MPRKPVKRPNTSTARRAKRLPKKQDIEYLEETESESSTSGDDDDDEEFVPETKKKVRGISEPSCSTNVESFNDTEDDDDMEEFIDIPEEPTPKKKPKKKAKASVYNEESDPTTSIVNFNVEKATPYLSYNESIWSPLHLYRLPSDITLSSIRNSGGEGLGRIEIGHQLMMDSSTKAGNRRVSAFIVNVCNDKKDYVGQFQKMEGKIRCIKYFWKANSQPERFVKLFEDFERLAGRPCPYKMGQALKFAHSKLSTLRISDVSLRRLNDLLEMVKSSTVVVTLQKVIKYIEEKERKIGYHYAIDKKSLMKCIKALEDAKFVRLLETDVLTPDNVTAKIQLLCHSDITSVDDPIVEREIQRTIDDYVEQGRVFPHGQLRYSAKKKAEFQEHDVQQTVVEEPIIVENGINLLDRYRLYRNQLSRAVLSGSHSKTALNTTSDDLNNTIDSQDEMDPNVSITSQEDVKEGYSFDSQNDFWSTVQLAGDRKIKINCEMSLRFGYQAKVMRFYIMHELAYHFVYSKCDASLPTFYERFPPLEDPQQWPARKIEELPLYDSKDSPFRFVPPLPPFNDIGSGYFMLIDIVRALPLSIYVLCVYVDKSIPKPLLNEYLTDPVKRYMCIADLPLPLRMPILKDKRLYRQLEHIFYCLGVLGLCGYVKNPDPKRFLSAVTSVFYISKRGVLYDTSTSERGYATVTQPMSRYDRYDYEFETAEDVTIFWHHLRAIVYSTPLAFRHEYSKESEASKHKKYSIGVFDKNLIQVDPTDTTIALEPLKPLDGCAGFDSSLFLHLRRHWELNPRPSAVTAWFIARFRKQSDSVKKVVEGRVSDLQADWNSYVKILMPSDMDLTKNKRMRSGCPSVYPSTRASLAIEPKNKIRLAQHNRKSDLRKKKRPMDMVDIDCQQTRVHVRSRFSSKERDMLILIRAIGFFLNPVYRFWLDPAVLRDIMHEYVPESRNKTVQSLMAAGVREMVRQHRLAYLQRIVRNLATFPEMRDLRTQLASVPLVTSEAKTQFFKEAFDVANRLLFMENQAMPNVNAANNIFEDYLKVGQVVIAAEQNSSNPLPMRSREPSCLEHVHHCVAVNILLSILIHSSDGSFSESILEQISPTVIRNALQVLRFDGLVSKTRKVDPKLLIVSKDQSVPSYYFRHFFAHRFHPDIVEQTYNMLAKIYPDKPGSKKTTVLEGDHVGLALVAAGSFAHDSDINVNVDEKLLSVFHEMGEAQKQSIKQIRYLENADLHLEDIEVSLTQSGKLIEVPTIDDLIKVLLKDRTHPVDSHPVPFEEFVSRMQPKERRDITAVYDTIKKTDIFGASLDRIATTTGIMKPLVIALIKKLINAVQINEVGVDCRRWVTFDHSDPWCVKVGNLRMTPRPWTLPNGGICPSTVRWMAESCLMTIVSYPGIPLKDLHFRFEFALQPAAIDDLISVLEAAGCVTVHEDIFESMIRVSPFDDLPTEQVFVYILPTVDGIARFSKIFSEIALLPSMMGGNKYDEEPNQASSSQESDSQASN